MSKEIRFYKKLLVLITIVLTLCLAVIVLHYESDDSPKFIGDGKELKTYTAQEVRNMIKKLPDYQGDSLLIDDDGRVTSLDGLIQSTLVQAYVVKANLIGIQKEAKALGLPEPYLVYKIAIKWYIAQYGSKTKQATDSLVVKDFKR
jgi:hypothetical protein